MRFYISLLLFLLGTSNGAQKNEGLILYKSSYTALLPFGQNIVIYEIGDEEFNEGELVNVSQQEIYLKDIITDKMILIPISNVKEIKTSAKSKKFENFKTGFKRGAGFATIATTGAIAILAIDNPDWIYGIFFAAIIVPPAAIAGGILNGLNNMSRATYQIENTDLFKINENSWRIKIPDNLKRRL